MESTQDQQVIGELESRYEWQALTWIVIALASVVVYVATGGDPVPTLLITFVMISCSLMVAVMAGRGSEPHPVRVSLAVAILLFAAALIAAALVSDTMSGWVYGAVFAVSLIAFVRKAVMTLRCR